MSSCFPQDVYFEILVRLPVKSLLRCKCVCKSWFRIIFNRNFFKMHHNLTIQKTNPSLMFGDLSTGSIGWKICSLSYDSLYSSFDISEFEDAIKYKFPPEIVQPHSLLYGYCNGLIYFWTLNTSKEEHFCLLNPATKEHKILPKPLGETINKDDIGICGFGYDCKIDDYKVIHVQKSTETNMGRCLVNVYTLRKNSWKSSHTELDMFPLSLEIGVLVKGALHWLGIRRGKGAKLIISLDISDEKFKAVEPPKEALENENSMTVGALDGLLCVLDEVNRVQFDVWVMQDYGVRDSWTKRYTITHEKIKINLMFVKLMWSFKNGEILFKNSCNFVLYEPKHGSVREFSTRPIIHRNVNYYESLVSLKSKRQKRRAFRLMRNVNV